MSDSRVEAILENMLGADNQLQPPQSRVEEDLLSILANKNDVMIVPVNPGEISKYTFEEIEKAYDKGFLIICNYTSGISKFTKSGTGDSRAFMAQTMAVSMSSSKLTVTTIKFDTSSHLTLTTRKYDLSSLVTS